MYSNELLVINQWQNVTISDCSPSQMPCYSDGDAVIEFYGFNEVNYVKGHP